MVLTLRWGGVMNQHSIIKRCWFCVCEIIRYNWQTTILSIFQSIICIVACPCIFRPDWPEKALQSQHIALAGRLDSHITSGCHHTSRWSFWIGPKMGQRAKVKVWEDWAAATRTFHIQPEPLINAFHMEIVSTGKATNLHHQKLARSSGIPSK